MIEGNLLPPARGVTSRTDRPKLPVMDIPGGVTGKAILWRAFVHIVDMAGLAGRAGM